MLYLYFIKQTQITQVMKTLSENLEGVRFPRFFERESNQECEILESKTTVAGATAYLVDFGTRKPTDHPGNAAGLYVAIIEEGEMVELDKDYVKQLFNR